MVPDEEPPPTGTAPNPPVPGDGGAGEVLPLEPPTGVGPNPPLPPELPEELPALAAAATASSYIFLHSLSRVFLTISYTSLFLSTSS